MPFGRDLEDFTPGEVFSHWPGRTITEHDNTLFCMLTMNHHPIHIDAHYAAHSQFGQRLVVGTLVFSLVVGMTVPDISGRAIANLAYESVNHDGPVFAGDTIYAETEVLDATPSRSKPDRGLLRSRIEVLAVDGSAVMTLIALNMIRRRPDATS